MMYKNLLALLISVTVVVLAGCATMPVPVAEVLQQKQGENLYTKSNLWYVNPSNIRALNIQEGRILPVGSMITDVVADDETLKFKDQNGQEYTIKLEHGLLMCSMREYISRFITTQKPEEMLKDVSAKLLPYIKRGEVVAGMSREDVLFAYGRPPACRTPDLKNETWLYWISPTQTIRVVFRNDKVRNVINASEPVK